tara:strand:+ start:123 stop:377 length:255 start_codon:yes stop_codon:yes gene_type:complete
MGETSRLAFIQQERNEQIESVEENLHHLYGSEEGLDDVLEILLSLYGSEAVLDCIERLDTEEEDARKKQLDGQAGGKNGNTSKL